MFTRRSRFRLGILVLSLGMSLPQHACAQTVSAWLYAFQGGILGNPSKMGIGTRLASARDAVYGHLPPDGAIGEIAVLQSVLSVGDQVPLPTFADGSQATESEIFWTAQLSVAQFNLVGIVQYRGGDHLVGTFVGRRFAGVEGNINTGGPVLLSPASVQVLVNVVAFRLHDHRRIRTASIERPTPQTLGDVKGRYR